MKFLRIFPVFFITLCALSSVNAATISIGTETPALTSPGNNIIQAGTGGNIDISQGTTNLQPASEYNIYTDGDMFLDYSVFSENQDLFIGSNISITGLTVTIFSFNDAPTMPNLSNSTIFSNISNTMNEVGNVLLFSKYQVLSGTFEATGNLYIGNYLSLQPVPLPASAVLFLSGLIMLGSGTAANKRIQRTAKSVAIFAKNSKIRATFVSC